MLSGSPYGGHGKKQVFPLTEDASIQLHVERKSTGEKKDSNVYWYP
jgi:hypothetical protein